MRLTEKNVAEIIALYINDLHSMGEIALKYDVSRTAIFKRLRQNGVDTSKRKLDVKCKTCGSDLKRTKKRVRRNHFHFCNRDCFKKHMQKFGEYKANKQGQRIARRTISKTRKLLPGEVVHHIDRDRTNNDQENLRVFKSQSDHIKHHFELRRI